MRLTLVLHIVAGALALVAGYVALSAVKGARLHRASGTVFVYVMLAMTTSGFVMAAARGAASLDVEGDTEGVCHDHIEMKRLRQRGLRD